MQKLTVFHNRHKSTKLLESYIIYPVSGNRIDFSAATKYSKEKHSYKAHTLHTVVFQMRINCAVHN